MDVSSGNEANNNFIEVTNNVKGFNKNGFNMNGYWHSKI